MSMRVYECRNGQAFTLTNTTGVMNGTTVELEATWSIQAFERVQILEIEFPMSPSY